LTLILCKALISIIKSLALTGILHDLEYFIVSMILFMVQLQFQKWNPSMLYF